MIFVGLGSNLVTVEFDSSRKLLESSINSMKSHGISIVGRSSWYSSAPIPASDQPWFTNGVVQVESRLDPAALLQALHAVEGEYERMRGQPNDSRTLDLDLLAYDDRLFDDPEGLKLPHPRLSERAFVLIPLAEMAPEWRHPESGLTAAEMLELLPPGQRVTRLS
jgi:2-amino-4-hydroxy-6-hydroxymethyldihydropteridine diphosphokinase